jgi:hypothetical protein
MVRRKEKDMVIIVSGNFVDGFQFHGPFPDRDAAATWDDAMNEGRGQVYTLTEPRGQEVQLPDNDYEVIDGVWLTLGRWSCRVTRVGTDGAKASFYHVENEDAPPEAVVEV